MSYCSHGDGKALGALVDCLEHCLGLRELRVAGWGLIAQHIEPLCRLVASVASIFCHSKVEPLSCQL